MDQPAKNSKPGAPSHHRLIDWARMLVMILLWGTAFALLKVSVAEVPPTTVVMGRLWVGALMLLIWVRIRGRSMPRLWGPMDVHWKWFALLGATGATIPFSLISWGQQSMDSAMTGIFMAIMPLATIALAHVFVPGEQMNLRKFAGFALGFIGVVILMGPQILFHLGGETFIAQIAVIFGALFYAVQAILARNMPPISPSVSAAGLLLCAAIFITPFGIVDAIGMSMPSTGALISILALGLGATGLGGILMMMVIRDAGPSFLALSNYLMPMVAVGVGMLIGEKLGLNVWVALVVILLGLALAGLRRSSN